MRLRGRGGGGGPVDWLVLGLGKPGPRYAGTPHNVGFDVASLLARRWELPRAKAKFAGLLTEGRAWPGGPRVAVLLPQTYMNEAGRSVGPARGAYKLPLEGVLVVHDVSQMEINDTITLADVTPPGGVALLDDPQETIVATLTPPRIATEDEDIEEETERVGEEPAGDAGGGDDAAASEA